MDAVNATTPKTKNLFNKMEWAGAFGDKKTNFYVMLIVAAFAMRNMGAAFLVGVILDNSLRRGWLKI